MPPTHQFRANLQIQKNAWQYNLTCVILKTALHHVDLTLPVLTLRGHKKNSCHLTKLPSICTVCKPYHRYSQCKIKSVRSMTYDP